MAKNLEKRVCPYKPKPTLLDTLKPYTIPVATSIAYYHLNEYIPDKYEAYIKPTLEFISNIFLM
tara:strand:- start:1102 stop:1293 length:192 start_codon:yes stop_codon:yes gene_type:complete